MITITIVAIAAIAIVTIPWIISPIGTIPIVAISRVTIAIVATNILAVALVTIADIFNGLNWGHTYTGPIGCCSLCRRNLRKPLSVQTLSQNQTDILILWENLVKFRQTVVWVMLRPRYNHNNVLFHLSRFSFFEKPLQRCTVNEHPNASRASGSGV